MFYFNPELFDDTKKIKSIYFMYLPEYEIKFNPEEIAMGLTYECGEFGQHTALFSYSEVPNIKHNRVWDFCVFPDFNSDATNLIKLKESLIMRKNDKFADEDIYRIYLEDFVLREHIPEKDFKRMCRNIISKYIKTNPEVSEDEAYIKLLEKLGNKMLTLEYGNTYDWIKKCAKASQDDDELEFDKLILEFINKPAQKENNINLKNMFNNDLQIIQNLRENNDLDSIFRNCRDYFLNKAVTFETKEVDEVEFDEKSFEPIKTGKKVKIKQEIPGSIIKSEDGKAKFEPKLEKKYEPRKNGDDNSIFDFDDLRI